MENLCMIGVILFVLFVVWASVPRRKKETHHIVKSEPRKIVKVNQRHPTYTNEEILLHGVDVRSHDAPRQIEDARTGRSIPRVELRGRYPGLTVDYDCVDGEVVDDDLPQLPSGRKLLRGG